LSDCGLVEPFGFGMVEAEFDVEEVSHNWSIQFRPLCLPVGRRRWPRPCSDRGCRRSGFDLCQDLCAVGLWGPKRGYGLTRRLPSSAPRRRVERSKWSCFVWADCLWSTGYCADDIG
jgi:hypothetical protein